MIPVKFYRNKNYVYVNNPDGTTSKMTLEEFKQHFSGGSGGLPEYDSGNAGEVLSVDADGDLVWKTLPAPSGGGTFVINAEADDLTGYITTNKTISEISDALNNGTPCFFCYPGEYEGDTKKYHLVFNITGGYQIALMGDSGSYYTLQLVSGETNIWSQPD